MLNPFGDKETEKIWNGMRSRKLPGEIQNVARRKLRMINNAQTLNDLRIPSAKFWLGLQADFDLEEENNSKQSELDKIRQIDDHAA